MHNPADFVQSFNPTEVFCSQISTANHMPEIGKYGEFVNVLDRTVVYIDNRPDAIIVMDEYHPPFICGSVMIRVTDVEGESFGEVYVTSATLWLSAVQKMERELRVTGILALNSAFEQIKDSCREEVKDLQSNAEYDPNNGV